ncbi:hypothetical protein BFS08_06380, partial [Gardnerella sp. KA00735]
YEQLIDRVRQTSFLVPGLRITVIDEHVPEGEFSDIQEIDVSASDDANANTSDLTDDLAFKDESQATVDNESNELNQSEYESEESESDGESEETTAQSVANSESSR